MNWDEKAKQNAIWCGYNSLALGVAEAKGIQTVYTHAARWQREQLLSQESVRKAAISLCRHDYPLTEDFQYHWENFNSLYIEKATTALAATLLGEE